MAYSRSMASAAEPTSELTKRIGTVSGLTLLSRIAGLVRDMVIAFVLGTGISADAFYVAFRIPNLMRRLLAEGALTMAFVPTYADYRRESPQAAAQAANTIFSALLTFLIILVAIGIVCAPWIVKMVAYGFTEHPEKFELTVRLARIMFPYLLCVSTMALMMGILNSHKHFIAPAAAPVFFNLCVIIGAAVLAQWFFEPSYGLALGVVLGGVAQLLVQVPPLWKRKLLPRFTTMWRHPSLRQLIRIMIPATYGGAVYQLNVMMITLFASFLPSGSVSYLWYADRITEFPLGIFAVAIATVTLPTLSEQRSAADMQAFRSTLAYGLKLAFAISIPAAVGIIVLAEPIVRLLFEGGAFTASSTQGTVAALYCFASGIPFVSAVRNLVPAFYALKDAKTPVYIASIALLVNAACAWTLMQHFAHQGLAASIVIASLVQASLLFAMLSRKLHGLALNTILTSALRSLSAAIVMGIAVWWGQYYFEMTSQLGRLTLLPYIIGAIAIGIATYIASLRYTNKPMYTALLAIVKRNK